MIINKNKMKKFTVVLFVSFLISIAIFVSCNSSKNEETILKGKATILVDESIFPIVEDAQAVFESRYEAKLTLLPKSENEAILELANQKAKIIVLSRKLNKEENKIFEQKKIVPRETPFGSDAIVFIKNKSVHDTLIDLQDITDFMKGKKNKIKGLVFDNPNSSTVRYMNSLAGLSEIPKSGVYSFTTSEEVINYVHSNPGLVGIVGYNWLTQPYPNMQSKVNNISILSVKNKKDNKFYFPSQDNIATKKYPLARDLFIINCQGYEGLGMGFSSFISGEIGQRIILKSGLVPFKMPSRKIITRKQLEK
jgi:phosphate transport system substrate-binding protein